MEFLKNKKLSPLNLIPFNFSFYQQSSSPDESTPLFKPGIIIDKYRIFSEYRNTFQNRFLPFFNQLLDNSSVFNDNSIND